LAPIGYAILIGACLPTPRRLRTSSISTFIKLHHNKLHHNKLHHNKLHHNKLHHNKLHHNKLHHRK
jgi:hypothetical protein